MIYRPALPSLQYSAFISLCREFTTVHSDRLGPFFRALIKPMDPHTGTTTTTIAPTITTAQSSSLNISPTLSQATIAQPTAPTHRLNNGTNDASPANITFGVFAILLALIGVLVAWLQLRSYKRRSPDRSHVELGGSFVQIVETQYVVPSLGCSTLMTLTTSLDFHPKQDFAAFVTQAWSTQNRIRDRRRPKMMVAYGHGSVCSEYARCGELDQQWVLWSLRKAQGASRSTRRLSSCLAEPQLAFDTRSCINPSNPIFLPPLLPHSPRADQTPLNLRHQNGHPPPRLPRPPGRPNGIEK